MNTKLLGAYGEEIATTYLQQKKNIIFYAVIIKPELEKLILSPKIKIYLSLLK